ncbi:MAG: thermonuclease family protein [Microgenomates group bacterium]|nr:thermonuclease family protein [Microgenomates group bacterium]
MQKLFNFILILITFISLSLNFYFYKTLTEQNRVVDVVDGDTFQLKSGKRVRLLGVDAPEYNRCGGAEAKKFLESKVMGKIVTIKEEQQETFGRSLALVYLNKNLINEMVLKSGWGRPDYRKNSQRDKLTSAYHYAKNNQLGIFSSLCRDDNPLTNCIIKGNIDKNTYQKFYHLPNCKHYNEIVIEKDIGERYFCSEEEAQKAGFKKASGCP